jgi:hypothetical protein
LQPAWNLPSAPRRPMRPSRLEWFCELQNFLSWIIPAWDRSTVVTDVAGDQDSKSGKQVTANRLNRRSASPQFKQPSSTSTVSLSTSTTKSDAIHDPGDDPSKMGFGPHAMRRDSSLQPRFAAGLVRSVFRLAGKYARSSALASG